MTETLHGSGSATPSIVVAPWGRRFGAWFIDNLLFWIPMILLTVPKVFRAFEEAEISFEPGAPAPSQDALADAMSGVIGFSTLASLGFAVALALYFILLHGTLGATLGKKIFGIKVIKEDGSRCDLAAAGKRAVAYPIGAGVPYFGGIVLLLNGLWPLWDPKKQSLGDKLGQTYVVRK